MKKFALYLFGISFVLIGILIFLVLNSSKEQELDWEFEVYTNNEGTNYKLKAANDYLVVVEDPILLPSGSFIKTNENTAFIILPDKSLVSIDKNTEININLSETGTQINQYSGRSWHRVANHTSNNYVVDTPTTSTSTSDANFSIETRENDIVKVSATQNQVISGQVIDEEGARIWKNEQPITANNSTEIIPFEVNASGFTTEEITEKAKLTNWYKSNTEIDELIYTLHDSERLSFINMLRANIEVTQYFNYSDGEIQAINISDELELETPSFDPMYLYDKFLLSNMKKLDGRRICESVNSYDETDQRKQDFIRHNFDTTRTSEQEYLRKLKFYCNDNVLDHDERKEFEL